MQGRARSFFAANAFLLGTLGIGLVNNVLIAVLFGLTERLDAFFAALVLPTLFMILCVDYLGKNFLPVFAAAKAESEETAAEMTSGVVSVVFVLALLAMAVFLLLDDAIFALLLPGFGAEELRLVSRYFAIMAPAMALMAATTFHEYLCQYDERYTTVVRIRACLPLSNLVCLLALGSSLGETSLAIGYTAGHVAVFLLMARAARYRYRPRLKFRAHLEARVFSNSAIVMSTGILARSKSLFVNYFASLLGEGVIAAIALAVKLVEPLQRGAFYAARMIMFSRTARLYQDGDLRSMVDLYDFGIRASFLLLAPLLWWAAPNADIIVALIFGHGAFTGAMVGQVGAILMALVPSILLIGVNQLLSNAFYAMGRVAVPAIMMPLATITYAIAAGPVSARLGAPGLTLTTTLVHLALFLGLIAMLARTLQDFRAGRLLSHVAGYVVLAGFWIMASTMLADALGAHGIGTALLTLTAGSLLYATMLYLAGETTLRRILAASRGIFVVRRAEV